MSSKRPTRKQVYLLLKELKEIAPYLVTKKANTLTISHHKGSLKYSIEFTELNKGVSDLELALIEKILLSKLLFAGFEVNCCCASNRCSVSIIRDRYGTHSSSPELAIALLQALVKFKKLEIEQYA